MSPSPKRGRSTPSAPALRAGGEDRPLLSQRREPLRLGRLHALSLSAFGAMAEVVGEVDGVGDAGGNGGRSAALSASRRRGGAAEVREDGVEATSEGERTAPVSSAYKEGRGGRFALSLKQPPTFSPTMPHSTHAVMGECGGYGTRFGVAQPACARALFWAWPNSARHHVWPRPGGSCRCTRVGVP